MHKDARTFQMFYPSTSPTPSPAPVETVTTELVHGKAAFEQATVPSFLPGTPLFAWPDFQPEDSF